MTHTPSVDIGALHRRYNDEVMNEGKVALIDELVSIDHTNHSPPGPDLHGTEALKQYVAAVRAAFPDLHFTVEEQIVVGDRVAVRWTARGTHRGTYLGVPATGRVVAVSGLSIHHFIDGRIDESWDQIDMLGLLQQLGAIPGPGRASG